MISGLGLWLVFSLLRVTGSSGYGDNKRQWKWTDDPFDFDFTPQIGDTVYEEIATVPLRPNVSCRADIDTVIRHIPSIDDSMSYQTTYQNGSKTFTLFQVKTLTACNIHHEKKHLQRREVLIGKRQTFKRKARINATPGQNMAIVSCGQQCPWKCNGVIVGQRHILTSAHCLDSRSPRNIQVGILGSNGQVNWFTSERFYTPQVWLSSDKGLKTKYDYSVIRISALLRKPGVAMQQAPDFSHKASKVYIQGFNGHQSACWPLTIKDGIQLSKCDNTIDSAGSGLFVGNPKHGYKLIGILSSYKVGNQGEIYFATGFGQKNIQQISNWINKH